MSTWEPTPTSAASTARPPAAGTRCRRSVRRGAGVRAATSRATAAAPSIRAPVRWSTPGASGRTAACASPASCRRTPLASTQRARSAAGARLQFDRARAARCSSPAAAARPVGHRQGLRRRSCRAHAARRVGIDNLPGRGRRRVARRGRQARRPALVGATRTLARATTAAAGTCGRAARPAASPPRATTGAASCATARATPTPSTRAADGRSGTAWRRSPCCTRRAWGPMPCRPR